MAGKAQRVFNYCHANPSAPNCPWPSYGPYVPPIDPCENVDPLSIGTTSCKTYVAYVNGYPFNLNNITAPRIPIIANYPPDVSGCYIGYNTYAVAPLFSDTNLTNQIGDVELSLRVIYDTSTNLYTYYGPANVTANTTVNWFDNSNHILRASLNAVYTYHLTSTEYGTGYPGSLNTTTISTNQQLFGQKVVVNTSVIGGPYPTSPIINKLIFYLS